MRRKRQSGAVALAPASATLQRACSCGQHRHGGGSCPACESGAAPLAEEARAQVDRTLSSPGRPIDAGAKHDMEARFGRDFSRVRVHTDAAAAESARAVEAQAYTVGQDVVFGAGRYAPATSGGRRLLAHELTHTIQQGGARAPAEGLTLAPADGPAEREAQRAGHRAGELAGGAAATVARTPAGVLQRAPDDAAATEQAPARAAAPPAAATAVPAAPPAPAPALTPAQIVEETIADFAIYTQHWVDAEAIGIFLDAALFGGTLDSHLERFNAAEELIDKTRRLRSDPDLRKRLRAAYIALLRAMMPVAARFLKVSVDDLYRIYSGRIPMWAWPIAHRTQARISTPVPIEGTTVSRGAASFSAGAFLITILPDTTDTAVDGAETKCEIEWGQLRPTRKDDADGTIEKFTGPSRPKATIQTTYGKDRTPSDQSGYGRGTTAEDEDAGSTSIGFHEGTHGIDFAAWLRSHNPPAFGGAAGQTSADFDTAVDKFKLDTVQYVADMKADTTKRTECVGTSIDAYDRKKAGLFATITAVKCTPPPPKP